jgi:CRP-like cAMP-binding protein
LFRGCKEDKLHRLSLKLKSVHVEQNDYVYRTGHVAKEMYFVLLGELSILDDHTGNELGRFQPGAFFGSKSLFVDFQRLTSVKCVSRSCDLAVLTRQDIETTMKEFIDKKDFPKFFEKMQKEFKYFEPRGPYPTLSTDIDPEVIRYQLGKVLPRMNSQI